MSDDTASLIARQDLRSFGRRRGRKLSATQLALMHELLPKVSLDLAHPAPANLSSLFDGILELDGGMPNKSDRTDHGAVPPHPIGELWLEIGFGGGEHLLWQAMHNPSVGCIGCEPYEDGVVKVLTAVAERSLGNIRLHADDARSVLRWLPEASIARAFVLFPDPWPKRKHQKRRLVNPEVLAQLARVIQTGGQLRLGTDIPDYARTMLMAAQREPRFRWTATGPDDWRRRPADWPQTRYEAKAVREGRSSCYLLFERV